MIKTVIFKLEGVVVNESLLYYKYYEMLWYHLRKYPEWQAFGQLMDARDKLLYERGHNLPYMTLAREYLSPRDFEDFKKQIQMFGRRNYQDYLRLVPGMRIILQTTRYYYRTALFTRQRELLQQAVNKFRLDNYFPHFSMPLHRKEVPTTRESIARILEEAQAAPEESVMISDDPESDLSVADGMGLYTIYTNFDRETQGILPHGNKERLYYGVKEKKPRQKLNLLIQRPFYDAVVNKPEEINKILARLETGETGMNVEKEEESLNFWEILKDVLVPNFSQ